MISESDTLGGDGTSYLFAAFSRGLEKWIVLRLPAPPREIFPDLNRMDTADISLPPHVGDRVP